MEHRAFDFKTLEELRAAARDMGLAMQFTEDLSLLARRVRVGSKVSPNALAVLPMEGCDSAPDGTPTEAVKRRYRRFAEGGAGLIWWEACAVTSEGRANPLQMMMTDANVGDFEELLDNTRKAGIDGQINILQLTHSGRYSRPVDVPAPIIAMRDPYLDPAHKLGEDYPVATDDYLKGLIDKFAKSAKLAEKAGFDGVDIKACHRYLLSELLAARTREGIYGGDFENRTRLMLEIIEAVKAETSKDFIIAARINAFDRHPYPYGFGVSKEDELAFDEQEPVKLVEKLAVAGVRLLGITAGNPYFRNPEVTRPFDKPVLGALIPNEHPLEGVARHFEITRIMQQAAGDVPVIGAGYSWLRQFLPYAAAANVANGSCGLVGLGRSSIAYPDAPRDILEKGGMDRRKCCIACSKCTQIMRDHGSTGCVVRDSEIYAPLYKQFRAAAEAKA